MLTILPDTNVLLHARALVDLPWAELGADEIDVVIGGPVVRELDAHKTKPGRIGKRARAVSAELRGLMKLEGHGRELRASNPRVRMRIALGLDVREAQRPGLDLGHVDQALVNLCLAIAERDRREVRLLTDDTFAAMMSDSFGLTPMLLPDSSRRPEEPDDAERALSQARAQLERLQKAEPAIELDFTDRQDNATDRVQVTMPRYRPLDQTDLLALMERVRAACPMADDFGSREPAERMLDVDLRLPESLRSHLSSMNTIRREIYTPADKADIEVYRTKHYPDWIANIEARLRTLHKQLAASRGWPEVTVVGRNNGTRPAADVLIEFTSAGDIRLAEPVDGEQAGDPASIGLPSPPQAPRGRWRTVHATSFDSLFRSHDAITGSMAKVQPLGLLDRPGPPPRDPDAFYWKSGRGITGERKSFTCQSWRHRADEETFEFRLIAEDDGADVEGVLKVRVNAANLSEPVDRTLPVAITFTDCDTLRVARNLVDGLAQRVAAAGKGMPAGG